MAGADLLHLRVHGTRIDGAGDDRCGSGALQQVALRFGDEVRDPREVFGAEREKKLDPGLLKLVSRLIEERKKPWSLDMVRDPV